MPINVMSVGQFPGLDTRSCNCAKVLGITNHAMGKEFMTKFPQEVLNVRNAGESTMAAMIEYFVKDNTSSWIPESNRMEYIHSGIKSFRATKITKDEWQYITNKWFESNKPVLQSQSKMYVKQLRRIHNGESLSKIARETNRCSATLQHQMQKAVAILNAYISQLPTFKAAQLLKS